MEKVISRERDFLYMVLASESLVPAKVFLEQRYVTTNTGWKFKTIAENVAHFVERHAADFVGGWLHTLNEASQVRVTVEERDTMLGTPDLIRHKATDQLLSVWGSVVSDLADIQEIPDDIAEKVLYGGLVASLTTDVAARESRLDSHGRPLGWSRILNFYYSDGIEKVRYPEEKMFAEIDTYCDAAYSSPGRVVRAVDSMLALAIAQFPVRTAKHRRLGRFDEPGITVYPSCEVGGLVMERHPLSDPGLRREFFSQYVESQRIRQPNLSTSDILWSFNGRAGLAHTEELAMFCRSNAIPHRLLVRPVEGKDDIGAFKQLAEGGTYTLLRDTLLSLNRPDSALGKDGFLFHHYPENGEVLRI